MKKLRTILILVLCMIIGTSVFAGCTNKNENKEDTIYAVCINKGYGTDWVNALLQRFCELNPQYKYDVEKVYNDDQIKDKIESGSQYCRWDLAFNGATYAADTNYLLSLNEIYNYEYIDGSRAGTTVISNVDDNALKGIVKKVNGQDVYYALPWTAEVGGLCVNNDAVKAKLGNDWRKNYPCRTTDELLEFCSALQSAGLQPLMHSATNDYYGGISRVWFAQYNGESGVSNYFEGRFSTPLGYQVGPAVAKNQGVLKAYEVLEALGKGGYYYTDGYGLEWDVAQTLFMSGATAMLPIGDWVQTEMNKQYPNVDVQFIRYPVLTSLGVDKLGITDDELSNIIAYVDGEVETKPSVDSNKGLSTDEVIEQVEIARSWSNSYINNFTVCIPEYSPKAEIAKEFLKFMVSDEGQEVYARATNGLTMCYGWNIEENVSVWNSVGNFAKSRWDIVKNARFLIRDRWESYGKAGLTPFRASEVAPLPILLSRATNAWSAQKAYEYDYETYEREWSALTARLETN